MRRAVTRRWTGLAAATIAVAALSVGAAPGETAKTASPRAGVPWRGHAPIRATVAEIMARRPVPALRPQEGRELEGRPVPAASDDQAPVTRAAKAATAVSTAATPTIGRSFLAAQYGDDSPYLPPDTMGSVGDTQILVHVNGRIRVFDKDGTLGDLDATDEAFWNSVRDGARVSDPQVEYDRLTDRWFVAAINVPSSGPNRVMLAVSDGPTITSATTWSFFQFQHDLVGTTPNDDTGDFADYPQMGVDANAVYIGANIFNSADAFQDSTAYVVRKSSLLGDGPIVVTAFRDLIANSNNGPWAPQGVSNFDPTATAGYIVGVNFDPIGALALRRIIDPGGTPLISPNLIVHVAPTEFPRNVPHLGGSGSLDGVDDRLFGATIVKNPAGQARLWTAHAIAADATGVADNPGSRNAVRWYELGNLAGTPTIPQTGTVFDSSAANPRYYWIPTIAASGQGHAALGMSTAGSTSYAGVAVATRLAADPAGTMSVPTIAEPGAAAYNAQAGVQRWGDYSQTVVDPSDNMTFWTFQEYTSTLNKWGVRVIELQAPPPATPAGTSPAAVPAGDASVDVEVTGTATSGSGFFDPGAGFDNRISAAVAGGVDVTGVDYVDPTHVVLHLDTTTASPGVQTVTITNPDGQTASGADLLTVCSGGDIAAPTLDASASDTTPLLGAPVDFDASASDDDCGVDPASYAWDFEDDGAIDSAGPTVTHAYSAAGTFTARAHVRDYAGNEASETISIVVHRPILAIGNARTREGNRGRHRVSLRVRLGAAPALPVTVRYRTRRGTARAPGDYTSRSGTLTFVPGDVAETIRIWIKGDVRNERNEYFFVRLSGARNAAIGDGSGKVVIVDDD